MIQLIPGHHYLIHGFVDPYGWSSVIYEGCDHKNFKFRTLEDRLILIPVGYEISQIIKHAKAFA